MEGYAHPLLQPDFRHRPWRGRRHARVERATSPGVSLWKSAGGSEEPPANSNQRFSIDMVLAVRVSGLLPPAMATARGGRDSNAYTEPPLLFYPLNYRPDFQAR